MNYLKYSLIAGVLVAAFTSTTAFAQQQKELWHSTDTLNDIQDWVNSANAGIQAVAAASVEDPVAAAALEVVDAAINIADAVVSAFLENQMGNPTPVNIPWEDVIKPKGVHWRGGNGEDIIYMVAHPKAGATPTLNFTQPKGNWWKAIVVFNKKNTNQWSEVCVVSGDNYRYHLNMDTSVASDNYVVLSKAKLFGVHTNMYLINNWADAPEGYDYTMYWVKD